MRPAAHAGAAVPVPSEREQQRELVCPRLGDAGPPARQADWQLKVTQLLVRAETVLEIPTPREHKRAAGLRWPP